ncbi:hypothetical protein KP509_15G073200 [Ceratopteris richardii]|uniref:Uncharacterized protein n=1 Tax=Ceratopteris richardii TaxID=49495 RepID=A0A8T2T4R3_CERRI|nr:hypothetical protein KP509_15G073200 [Ceratopteris richardii]
MEPENQDDGRIINEWLDENELVFRSLPQRRRELLRHQHVIPTLRQPLSDITHLISSDVAGTETSSISARTAFPESRTPGRRRRRLNEAIHLTVHPKTKITRLTVSYLR